MRYLLLIFTLCFTLNADVLDFYKNALETLKYNKTYLLYEHANELQQSGVQYSKYANFALDADYSNTKAVTLATPFNTTNVAFTDTMDLFGKQTYKINELKLGLDAKKETLKIKKEQLFISLVNMISIYLQTTQKLQLHQDFLNEQDKIYNKLQLLKKSGTVSDFELLRFKNTFIQLKITMENEKSHIAKMAEQLHSYAPKLDIPNIKEANFLYTKDKFLSNNPQKNLNEIDAKQLMAQAKTTSNKYLPDVIAGASYQKITDPTSYGNNYSFNVGIHIPLNSDYYKQAEALRVNALSIRTKNIEYIVQRKNEYIQRFQDYQNAKTQLKILNENLADYNKSEKTITIAFLKQFVNFNTYLQVLTQVLNIKEQIIQMKYQKISQALIVNSISSGVIYE